MFFSTSCQKDTEIQQYRDAKKTLIPQLEEQGISVLFQGRSGDYFDVIATDVRKQLPIQRHGIERNCMVAIKEAIKKVLDDRTAPASISPHLPSNINTRDYDAYFL